MAEITASLVKELRERTGAGMMDCKKALLETGGDLEAAVDWLRTKGLSQAAKKSGRVASEGLVGVRVEGGAGAIIEVNAETDFVARNGAFQQFVGQLAALALETKGGIEKLKTVPFPGTDRSVADELTHQIATIGENLALRRVDTLSVGNGVLASYVHNSLAPGLGKIGVLVALESDGDRAALDALGKQIAMHVAAAKPQAVDRDGLDAGVVAHEREILAGQARDSGKPENIIEKMVEGRMRKFYEEACLVDQTFVIDGETKVSAVLDAAAREAGAPVTVKAFRLFVLGEGIEKKQEDFAAEVAAAVGD